MHVAVSVVHVRSTSAFGKIQKLRLLVPVQEVLSQVVYVMLITGQDDEDRTLLLVLGALVAFLLVVVLFLTICLVVCIMKRMLLFIDKFRCGS